MAVKVIDLEDAVDEIEDIQYEITFMKQLDCPYITKYYDSFVKDAKLSVIMECCQGGALTDVMKMKPLDENCATLVLRDVLKGLEYLHGEGKLHRDIKAANVLLQSDGTVRICDFGVSGQLSNTVRKKSTFLGSPLWMSPEVITESGYDEKVRIQTLISCARQKGRYMELGYHSH